MSPPKTIDKYPFITVTGARKSCAAINTNSSCSSFSLLSPFAILLNALPRSSSSSPVSIFTSFSNLPFSISETPSSNFRIGITRRATKSGASTSTVSMLNKTSNTICLRISCITLSASLIGHSAKTPHLILGICFPAPTTGTDSKKLKYLSRSPSASSVPPSNTSRTLETPKRSVPGSIFPTPRCDIRDPSLSIRTRYPLVPSRADFIDLTICESFTSAERTCMMSPFPFRTGAASVVRGPEIV